MIAGVVAPNRRHAISTHDAIEILATNFCEIWFKTQFSFWKTWNIIAEWGYFSTLNVSSFGGYIPKEASILLSNVSLTW